MSITRREFLLGTGAGLLLPKTYDFFANFLAKNGEPFLEKPSSCAQTIYCSDIFGEGGLRLLLDTPEYEIPDFSSFTYEEFFREFFPDWLSEPDFWETRKDWYPREAYIDEWTAFDLWVRRHSPDVKAFELLEWVDLGETRSSRDGVDGWIDFTDGVHPGNDSRFTDVDHLGASILQHRLNELNMGIEVALA